jgi:hypothetical protein
MNGIDRMQQKVTLASTLVRGGNLQEVKVIIGDKTWAKMTGLGLRRDLEIPFSAPEAAIPITVRLLREDDVPLLLGTEDPTLSGAARVERLNRVNMVRAGFARCFVAANAEDRPCYMQFLIGADENDLLRTHFRGLYPVLAPDEALLEGAFTPEGFRGQRIMPSAMAQIAAKAAERGARWVMTYVGDDNIASLKGCKRAGFVPFQEREERWRFFRQRISFTALPPGTPYSFDLPATPTGAHPTAV